MKHHLNHKRITGLATLLLLTFFVASPRAALAQDHVVSQAQLQNAVSDATAARQLHEQQIKSLLSMQPMQQAMKSRGVDPQQVMHGVDQLSDAELATLAAQSQKAQQDFAAGRFGTGVFLLIGLVVVAVVLAGVFG